MGGSAGRIVWVAGNCGGGNSLRCAGAAVADSIIGPSVVLGYGASVLAESVIGEGAYIDPGATVGNGARVEAGEGIAA